VHEALVHGRVWHLTAIYFTFSASMYDGFLDATVVESSL